MSAEPKVLHEWELAGYHGRIVETQPGIVTSEQSMDDDKRGRLWVSNRCPIGWPNEMIHLAMALRAAQAERDALRAERDEMAQLTIAAFEATAEYEDFHCPHEDEHRCNCGRIQRQLFQRSVTADAEAKVAAKTVLASREKT